MRRLPEDLELRTLSDPSTFVDQALREVRSSAVGGGLLAVLVLFLFLRRLGPTGIVAVSIPLSLIATFAPFDFAGISLNVMSLGGLALGVGMLVDNSIVVLESITRHRERGEDRRTAAWKGVREVGGAVTASTLTTVAVFLPIVFVHGLAGRIFRDLSMAVVFSLVASLGVALFFIPTLIGFGSRKPRDESTGDGAEREPSLGPWATYQSWISGEGGRGVLQRAVRAVVGFVPFCFYALVHAAVVVVRWIVWLALWIGIRVIGAVLWLLATALRGPAFLVQRVLQVFAKVYARACHRVVGSPGGSLATCAVALALFGVAAFLFGNLGSELLPEIHQGELVAKVRLAVEAPVERTDASCTVLSDRVREIPGVAWVASAAGIARDEIAEPDEGEHSAELLLRLDPVRNVAAVERDVKQRFGALAAEMPEFGTPKVEPPSLLRVQTPIQLEIHGTDLPRLRQAAETLAEQARSSPVLADVETNFARGPSEVIVEFDREALHRRGVRLDEAAERLRNAVQGDVATRFSEDERKIDVLVRIGRERLDSLEALEELSVTGPGVDPVPLRAVASTRVDEGPAEIRQIRGDRVGVVTARPRGFDLGGASRELSRLADGLELDADMHWELGGQSRESDAALRSLLGALLLAVFLVYIVLAAQFESFLQPLIIIGSIPLATIGVVFALSILGWNLSVVVLLGAILLAGIVVNNAILLIDAINRLRREGRPRTEAIVEAGLQRLRPILMTTTTTVLGLLPLTGALDQLPGVERLPFSLGGGAGAELRAPMAVTVIAGLLASTLLTLFVVPACYAVADRLRGATRKRLGWDGA